MNDEFTFDADVLLETIKKARAEYEESETQVKKARQKRDNSTRQLKKIVEKLYEKNLELVNKLKECEGNNG